MQVMTTRRGSVAIALIAAAVAGVSTMLGVAAFVLIGTAALLGTLITVRIATAAASRVPDTNVGHLLLYAYAAAIPLNNLLPPGPAGTVARITGIVFFVGFMLYAPGTLRFGSIPWVGWAFAGWALASSLWAISPDVSLSVWVSLAQLLAISVLIASIVADNPGVVRGILWAYALPATVTGLLGAAGALGGGPELDRAAAFEDQSPAHLAGLLVPAGLFLITEAQAVTQRRIIRVGAAACATICMVAVLLSGTRAGWLALAVGAVWWLLRSRSRQQLWVLGATALVVVGLIAVSPKLLDFLGERAASGIGSGGSGRTEIWTVGLSIFASSPLVGVGVGNFPEAFTPYAISQAVGASTASGTLYAGRDPHNVLLGTAVETGLVGVVLFGALLAWGVRSTRDDRKAEVAGTLMIAMLTLAMFSDLTLRKEFWLVIAVAHGLAAARRAAEAREEAAAWRTGAPVGVGA